ncbi:MAG TPA: glycosyltransferase family 2 protein [Bacteroidales bacterium]
MEGISAVIITKNEEQNIERCLRSIVETVDEIIIVDSGSTDRTEEIASIFKNVKFINHAWEGYSKSKNYGNSLAKFDWILSIDADEALSAELCNSIVEAKKIEDIKFYRFARLTNYCGKWIKHCHWYPDCQIRLFNKKHTTWIGDSIHEKLHIDSVYEIITLKGDCLHFTVQSIEDHLSKVNLYSSVWAKEAYKKGKRGNIFVLAVLPFTSFIRSYFIKKGFLDGYYGFIISVILGISRFQRISKLINLEKTGKV